MKHPPHEHLPSAINFEAPPSHPLESLRQWFDAAGSLLHTPNPNAMSVATVDPDGKPSVRVVLCRAFDADGVVFFTNRMSRKGRALTVHPNACCNFHWDSLDRQVRIDGAVTHTSEAESDTYWLSRPHANRANAVASDQSHPITDRAALEAAVRAVEARYPDGNIPRPPHWGGYRIALDRVEFWQGHKHRLHDRIVYTRKADGTYTIVRLAP